MANTLKFGNGEWATKEGSVLAYNDENGNFKPLPFDFSRSTSATRVNKEGLIEVVSNNEPRIDFSNDAKGVLLLEPTRSNIFDYSSDLSAWSKLNSTVTESSVLSLDGVNNSYGCERTSSSSSYIYRAVSLANTTQYTLSFFVKSGTSTNIRVDVWDSTQSTQCQIQVDLETKAVSNFIGTSYKIEDYTNGWMRISVVFTSESNFGQTFNRYFNDDIVGSELYIWGAQLEAGSYATSYIPTQGSIGTRVSESCSQAPPSGIINNSEGTIFAEIKAFSVLGNQYVFDLSDNTSSNRVGVIITATKLQAFRISPTDTSTSINSTFISANTKYKLALAYSSGRNVFYLNGFKIGEDTNAITSLSINKLDVFQRFNSTERLGGECKDLKLYNTALTDQELQKLTTL